MPEFGRGSETSWISLARRVAFIRTITYIHINIIASSLSSHLIFVRFCFRLTADAATGERSPGERLLTRGRLGSLRLASLRHSLMLTARQLPHALLLLLAIDVHAFFRIPCTTLVSERGGTFSWTRT